MLKKLILMLRSAISDSPKMLKALLGKLKSNVTILILIQSIKFIDDERESKWCCKSDPTFIGSIFFMFGLGVGLGSLMIYFYLVFKVTTNSFPYTGPQKEAVLWFLYMYALHVSLLIVLPSIFIGLVYINFHSWAGASRIILSKLGLIEFSFQVLSVLTIIGAFISGIVHIDFCLLSNCLEIDLFRITYILTAISCFGSLFRMAFSIKLLSRGKVMAVFKLLIIIVLLALLYTPEFMFIVIWLKDVY